VTTRPVLANTGAMSQFIGAFEVTSKLTGQTYLCRFSHMWNGIATRHADTIDTKFFCRWPGPCCRIGAHRVCKVPRKGWPRPDDREASFVAAEYLRERLEEEDVRPLYDVALDDVRRLIGQVGIK